MNKKILAALLAALMLAPTFTACSESSTNSETEPAAENTATPSAEEETAAEETAEEDSRASISDDLPEMDFEGQNFRVLTTEGGAIYGFDYSSEIIAEELNGDACNDAVYNRNLAIETRFDTKITCQMNATPARLHRYSRTERHRRIRYRRHVQLPRVQRTERTGRSQLA